MKFEESFGIIPLKNTKKGWQVLLLRHGKGHWSFPKGHAEKGEEPLVTAMRELEEESGLKVKRLLPCQSVQERYFFTWHGEKISKTVTYFLAEVEGRVKTQQDEISDYIWLPLEKAHEKITFPEGKRLCQVTLGLLTEL